MATVDMNKINQTLAKYGYGTTQKQSAVDMDAVQKALDRYGYGTTKRTPVATVPVPEAQGKTFKEKVSDLFKGGVEILADIGNTMSYSDRQQAADALTSSKNDKLATLGTKVQALNDTQAKKGHETTKHVGERAASGAITGTKNAINYLSTLSQRQNAQMMRDQNVALAALGDLTNNENFKQGAIAAHKMADEQFERSTDPLVNFGTKYAQNVENRYDVSDEVREAAGVAETLGALVPSVASNILSPGSGLFVVFASAAGNATQEAIQNGADKDAALLYGTAVGALEAITEKAFDGLAGALGKGTADEWLGGLVKRAVKNEGAQKAVLRLANTLGEGIEEFAAEVGDRLINEVLIDTDDRNWRETLGDAGYSALMGMVVSGIMQAAGSINTKDPGKAAEAVVDKILDEMGEEGGVDTEVQSANDSYGVIDYVLNKGRVNNATANEIINTPEMSAAFTDVTGYVLEGTTENKRSIIRRAVREHGVRAAQNDAIAREAATQAEIEDAEAKRVQAQRDSGYRSYVRGIFLKGATVADAQEILGNPELKAEWENVTGKRLPSNPKSATKMILETKRNANSIDLSAPKANTVAEAKMTVQGVAPVTRAEVVTPASTNATANSAAAASAETGSLPEAMGAASVGFADSEYNRWVNDAPKLHKTGEKAARNASLPTKNLQGKNTTKVGQAIMETEAIPDKRVAQIQNMYVNGELSYLPDTNDAQIERARATIEHDGWAKTVADWRAKVASGASDADTVALGATILINSANSDMTDAEFADVLTDYAELVSRTASALQAHRVLKMLTPEGRLYGIQRSIESLNKALGLEAGVTLDPALMAEYRKATTDAERDTVIVKMQKDVAKQVPSTLKDKWTALRYVNMLGNFKTQIRNLAGNASMTVLKTAKDVIGTGIEALANKITKGKVQRTKSLTVGKEWMNAARKDADKVASVLSGDSKYKESDFVGEFMRGVDDYRTIFKNKVLEAYRKATNWAMNKGDAIFSEYHYARSLAGYLKANGVTAEDFEAGKVDSKLLDKAREYAIKQAQEATLRDNNVFSNWVSKIGRRAETPRAVKAIAEGVAPFRRTPANVLVRATEYSPVGLVTTAIDTVKAAKGDSNITSSDIIDSLSKNLTGTALLVLGAALRSAGALRGSIDEEDKDMAELRNQQAYSIVIPGKGSYTLDWLSPASLILFTGADLMDKMQDQELSFSDLEEVFTSLSEPLVEMSMLSGVNDALDNVKYSDNSLIQMAASSALNYLTQGLTNTLLGQAERTVEPNRMTTYVDDASTLPDWAQKAIGKASAKIPVWDYNQTEYRDNFGNTESNGTRGSRFLENFLSPGYWENEKSGELYDLIERAKRYDGSSAYPDYKAPEKVNYDGDSYTLTRKEQTEYQRTRGEYYLDAVELILEAADRLDDEEATALTAAANTFAEAMAKSDFLDDREIKHDAISGAGSFKKVIEAAKNDVDLDIWFKVQEYADNASGKDKQEQITKYINKQKMSDEAKDAVYLLLGYSEKNLNKTPWNRD